MILFARSIYDNNSATRYILCRSPGYFHMYFHSFYYKNVIFDSILRVSNLIVDFQKGISR